MPHSKLCFVTKSRGRSITVMLAIASNCSEARSPSYWKNSGPRVLASTQSTTSTKGSGKTGAEIRRNTEVYLSRSNY